LGREVLTLAEYINRNELVENLEKFAPEHLTPLIKTLIEKQPTADVVEVKKVVEMLCKIKTAIIKNVSTMIEDDFNKIVKDVLNERRDT
jgi:hypothetical protein